MQSYSFNMSQSEDIKNLLKQLAKIIDHTYSDLESYYYGVINYYETPQDNYNKICELLHSEIYKKGRALVVSSYKPILQQIRHFSKSKEVLSNIKTREDKLDKMYQSLADVSMCLIHEDPSLEIINEEYQRIKEVHTKRMRDTYEKDRQYIVSSLNLLYVDNYFVNINTQLHQLEYTSDIVYDDLLVNTRNLINSIWGRKKPLLN